MRPRPLKKFYVLNTGVSTIGPLAEAERDLAPLGITLRSLNILEVDKQLPQADSLAEPPAFLPKSPALRRNLQGRRLLNQS